VPAARRYDFNNKEKKINFFLNRSYQSDKRRGKKAATAVTPVAATTASANITAAATAAAIAAVNKKGIEAVPVGPDGLPPAGSLKTCIFCF